jgi:hypothetical protein
MLFMLNTYVFPFPSSLEGSFSYLPGKYVVIIMTLLKVVCSYSTIYIVLNWRSILGLFHV